MAGLVCVKRPHGLILSGREREAECNVLGQLQHRRSRAPKTHDDEPALINADKPFWANPIDGGVGLHTADSIQQRDLGLYNRPNQDVKVGDGFMPTPDLPADPCISCSRCDATSHRGRWCRGILRLWRESFGSSRGLWRGRVGKIVQITHAVVMDYASSNLKGGIGGGGAWQSGYHKVPVLGHTQRPMGSQCCLSFAFFGAHSVSQGEYYVVCCMVLHAGHPVTIKATP